MKQISCRRVPRRLLLFAASLLVLVLGARTAWAGPPFFTDDPEPVELHHWEIYVATQWTKERDAGASATLPHLEANYGVAPDTQLHAIVPMAYSAPRGSAAQYGMGDVELGVKYRFLHEDEQGWRPQAGIFPLVELPAGDSSRGLGSGRVAAFFPVWVQKSWGTWTTYGGGGYWYQPGEDNRNYWFAGWLLQRDFSRKLTLGAEVFNTSPKARGESDETGFNGGGIYNLSEEHHILFSAGRDMKGPATLFAYLAFQWTFGPSGKEDLPVLQPGTPGRY
jgi:hypothetical protein